MDAKTIKSKRELWIFFLITGVAFIIFGIIHVASYVSTSSSVSLYDAIFNSLLGIIFLIASGLVYKGKHIVIIIPIIFTIAGIIYSFALGRGFNYFALLYAIFIVPWILSLRKNNALS